MATTLGIGRFDFDNVMRANQESEIMLKRMKGKNMIEHAISSMRNIVGLCPEDNCWAYVKDDTQMVGSRPMRVLLWGIIEDKDGGTEVIGLVFDESAGFIRPVDEIEGFSTYKKGLL